MHHYINAVHDTILRVVMTCHLLKASCKAHAIVTIYCMCLSCYGKKITRSQEMKASEIWWIWWWNYLQCHQVKKKKKLTRWSSSSTKSLACSVAQLKFVCNVGWIWKLFSPSQKGKMATIHLLASRGVGFPLFHLRRCGFSQWEVSSPSYSFTGSNREGLRT